MIRVAQDRLTWGPAVDAAVAAVARGGLIVFPTDTVYGIGCDAFNPAAVGRLLAAKGRDRSVPPPVLMPNAATMAGLADEVSAPALALAQRWWPGALTLIVQAQPSLAWDLGDTGGTVALRVPDHPLALALLERTGPLAVTSANLHTQPAALTCQEAFAQLGEMVAEYLDGGPAPGQVASTIVAATGAITVVRAGAIATADILATATTGEPGTGGPRDESRGEGAR